MAEYRNENELEVEIIEADRFDAFHAGEIEPRARISSQAHRLFVLLGHDGLSSPPSELAHLDQAILEGGTVSGARAQSRRITLDFVAPSLSYPEISSHFPLGQKEVLKVRRGSTARIIEGYRDGPIEVNAVSALATPVISVSFLCPSPYFRNDVEFGTRLDGVTGGLRYPLGEFETEPYGYPVHYGVIDGEGSTPLENHGDYPAPFVLSMTASVSGTLGISIDGISLARIEDVASGEHIVFDTVNKMLWIDGVKRLSALRGAFPRVPIGRSYMSLSGLAGNPKIRFSELFEGV
jgi:hypothetical protein